MYHSKNSATPPWQSHTSQCQSCAQIWYSLGRHSHWQVHSSTPPSLTHHQTQQHHNGGCTEKGRERERERQRETETEICSYWMFHSQKWYLHEGDSWGVHFVKTCNFLIFTSSIINMNNWFVHFTATYKYMYIHINQSEQCRVGLDSQLWDCIVTMDLE